MRALLARLAYLQLALAKLSELEEAFIAVPSPSKARESLKYITSIPHVAGTPGDLHMANYVKLQLLMAGIPDVELDAPKVLLSYPRDRSLTLLDAAGAEIFNAPLAESVRAFDETSDTWWRNHTFNGYSPSGDVTAPLVYANFGTPDDFDVLEAAGVKVAGAIVITRYGRCFRGLKAMNAEQRGAKGVIIYSDPQQDGYKDAGNRRGVIPDGPWRPADGVQRGSVQFNSLCAGDPGRNYLGGGSAPQDVCGYEEKDLLPSIPVLPISYGDALPLLQALGGPAAPEAFQGALPVEYQLGPSEGKVHLMTDNYFVVSPIWSVIATIPGLAAGEGPAGEGLDRPVVLGNHRDAWVFGAVDPNSGTAAMIELARGLGALLAHGWRPQRSIVLCSWSGEEYGLLGSTAWGETRAATLLSKAIAYLNVDSAVSGKNLHVKATPSLASLLRSALADLPDPSSVSGGSLLDSWSGKVSVLGSGSDYTVFLHHLGMASLDFEFQNDLKDDYGTYHSIYDSFAWQDLWGDPTWAYHATAARLWGLLALRLADAEVLPFNHVEQAGALADYLADLQDRLKQKMLQQGEDLAAAGPSSKAAGGGGGGGGGGEVGSIDLSGLEKAVEQFGAAADEVGRIAETARLVGGSQPAIGALSASRRLRGGMGPQIELARWRLEGKEGLNDRLAFTERQFLSQGGLPRRKWFKHVLQAPGLFLGYTAESFPGVTQAVADGDMSLAQEQADEAAERILAAASWLLGEGQAAAPDSARMA